MMRKLVKKVFVAFFALGLSPAFAQFVVPAPNGPAGYCGTARLAVSNVTARVQLPASLATCPIIVITPNAAQNDIYIAQGDVTVTAAVTATNYTCAQGGATFCSHNIGTAASPPLSVAGFGYVAAVSPAPTTINIDQYSNLPNSAGPTTLVAQNFVPFGSWFDNIVQFGGSAVVFGTGVSLAGVPRFALSNDSLVGIWNGINGPLDVLAPSTLPTATNKAMPVSLMPNSPTLNVQGVAGMTPVVTTTSGPYPNGAVPITATATGTTAATAATLAGTAGKTTYICGFTITADATALATGTAVVSGTISGSLSYLQTVLAAASGTSDLTKNFNPCIPASASNTAIVATSAAAGTGGNTIVNAQGYQL